MESDDGVALSFAKISALYSLRLYALISLLGAKQGQITMIGNLLLLFIKELALATFCRQHYINKGTKKLRCNAFFEYSPKSGCNTDFEVLKPKLEYHHISLNKFWVQRAKDTDSGVQK